MQGASEGYCQIRHTSYKANPSFTRLPWQRLQTDCIARAGPRPSSGDCRQLFGSPLGGAVASRSLIKRLTKPRRVYLSSDRAHFVLKAPPHGRTAQVNLLTQGCKALANAFVSCDTRRTKATPAAPNCLGNDSRSTASPGLAHGLRAATAGNSSNLRLEAHWHQQIIFAHHPRKPVSRGSIRCRTFLSASTRIVSTTKPRCHQKTCIKPDARPVAAARHLCTAQLPSPLKPKLPTVQLPTKALL